MDSSVDYQNNDIKIAAFNSPDKKKLTLVLTNTQYQNSKVRLNLNGYNVESSAIYLTNYQEGASDRMAEKGMLGEDMTVELPAQSVMTVDITGNQGDMPSEVLKGEKAPENTSEKVQAIYGTPKLDGEIDEIWNSIAETKMLNAAYGDHGASGTFKTMWDEKYLYVLVDVTDENLDDTSANDYEQDSVEFFINESHEKPDSYENGDAQYRVNYKNKQSFGSGTPDTENFNTSVKLTDKGYIVEAAIPLRLAAGKEGAVLGFDVQINDSHGEGVRDYILKWSDPSDNTWGNLEEIGDVEFIKQNDTDKHIKVLVDGEAVEFPDQEPVIINDRVMLPIRTIAETVGLDVDGDAETRTVGIGNNIVSAYSPNETGKIRVYANGTEVIFPDQEPVIMNERTLISVRAVAETIGMNVDWDEDTYTVIITQ